MDNIIGLGILLLGGYLKYTAVTDLDHNKGWAALVGGVIYLLWVNAGTIKEKLSGLGGKGPNPEQIFKPDDYELFDTECLVHLRNRCIENQSTDGVETCAKLNSIIFGFKNVSKKEKKVDEKTT